MCCPPALLPRNGVLHLDGLMLCRLWQLCWRASGVVCGVLPTSVYAPVRLQSEAERLLAGARDLEESIGVSLSARRFEVRCVRCGCAVVAGPRSLPVCRCATPMHALLLHSVPVLCHPLTTHHCPCTTQPCPAGQPPGAAAVHCLVCSGAGRHGGRHLRHEPAQVSHGRGWLSS